MVGVRHDVAKRTTFDFGDATAAGLACSCPLTAARCALLFPLLCAVGGGLLLTHSHASLNLKEEFLNEITHAPLGLLGVLVGWGRWLELRLPRDEERLPRWVWSGALTAVGLLLLLYRER